MSLWKLYSSLTWKGVMKGMETGVNHGAGQEFTDKAALVCLGRE